MDSKIYESVLISSYNTSLLGALVLKMVVFPNLQITQQVDFTKA